MSKRRLVLICVSTLVISMASCDQNRDRYEPRTVSLIQLIATPEAFHGQIVTVAGVIRLDFEGTALYYSKADSTWGLAMNSIWLRLEREQIENYKNLEGQYVLLEGRFNHSDRGHFGLFPGAIDEISGIMPLLTVEEFRQQQMRGEPEARSDDSTLQGIEEKRSLPEAR